MVFEKVVSVQVVAPGGKSYTGDEYHVRVHLAAGGSSEATDTILLTSSAARELQNQLHDLHPLVIAFRHRQVRRE